LGSLGKERVFIACRVDQGWPGVPTDLLGITLLPYKLLSPDLKACVAPVANAIRNGIEASRAAAAEALDPQFNLSTAS
jgi:predicted nucleotide-binding protein